MPESRLGRQHAELRFIVSVLETVLVEFHLRAKNIQKSDYTCAKFDNGVKPLPHPEVRHRLPPDLVASCREDLGQRSLRRQELNPSLNQNMFNTS